MESEIPARRTQRRGIYLLPNLLTTGCLFAGFYAIVAAIDGNFERAGVAVFVAMIFDGLDGRVARLTSTESAFGKEYDSLADMVAFGLAPAIVSYQWGVARIAEYGKAWYRFGWVAAFFFAAACALRLARFNVRAALDKRYFEGLPCPSAAAVVAAFVWLSSEWREPGLPGLISAFLITASAGALMISRFSYSSFKQFDLSKPVRFIWLVVVVLGFVILAPHPQSVLLAVFGGYALWAPLVWVWRRLRRSQRDRAASERRAR
ncbi:MAG: CDP-diacylglycerol--serine O-phosphatidyltransferase [Steroidobacterales bacterium]